MKYAVLVSGGVDSSVALRLVRDQGHQVTAFYIKIWLEDELSYLGSCPWQEDLKYVEAVCTQLNVPLEIISLQREYWDEVVGYALAEVRSGRTPNPDILCNQRIKFGAFYGAIHSSFDKIATGHYAAVQEHEGKFFLVRTPDPIKDQTYFLAMLNQQQLSRASFPLGAYDKSAVRALAHQFDLPTKLRKDSQGICFLGKLKFDDFLRHHLGTLSGPLIEIETGNVVGTHEGFWFYTIGQRKGIGLSGGPWYVVSKNPQENRVYISKNYYDVNKMRNSFILEKPHWINSKPVLGQKVQVKLRHGAQLHECTIDEQEGQNFLVNLLHQDQGIAPGQFAVFYENELCLGGGVIGEMGKTKV